MFIKSIYYENYAKFKNELILFDKPHSSKDYFGKLNISTIIGENGSGKTSLLLFLANAFKYPKVNRNLKKYFKSHFNICYEIGDYKYNLDSKSIIENSNTYPKKILVSSNSLYDKFGDNYKNERVQFINTTARNMHTVISIIETNIKKDEKIQKLLKLIGFSSSFYIGIDKVSLHRLASKFYNPTNPQVVRSLNSLISFYESRDYFIESHPDNKSILIFPFEEMHSEWFKTVKFLDSENVNLGLRLFFQKNGSLIDMRDMSSGEQTMFARFFPLIVDMEDNCIVIIDEPEVHLHPTWIQHYIYTLVELFSEYNSHIILATHSPLIISDIPKECIVAFKYTNNEKTAVTQLDPYDTTLGSDPSIILREVFQLGETMGRFTKKIHEKILQLAENNEIEEALELYQNLGTSIDKFELYSQMKETNPKEF
jgi:predicted ATP-dependent endonuclease of OLD family